MGRRTIDIDIVLPRRRTGDVFEESKHQRNHGKFSSTGGGSKDSVAAKHDAAAAAHRAAQKLHTEAQSDSSKSDAAFKKTHEAHALTDKVAKPDSRVHLASLGATMNSDPKHGSAEYRSMRAKYNHADAAKYHEAMAIRARGGKAKGPSTTRGG